MNQINKNIGTLVDQLFYLINVYNLDHELERQLTTSYSSLLQKVLETSAVDSKISDYSSAFNQLQLYTTIIGANKEVYTSNPTLLTDETLKQFPWYGPMISDADKVIWLPSHSSFYPNAGQTAMFSVAKVLQNTFSKRSFGVLVISMKEQSLYDIYKDSLSSGNEIMIIDGSGAIVSDSVRSRVGAHLDPATYVDPASNQSTSSRIVTIGGQSYLSLSRKVDKLGWYTVEIIPLSTMTLHVDMLRHNVWLVSLLCLLMSVVAAIVFSRNLLKPLIRLNKRIATYRDQASPRYSASANRNDLDILADEYDNIIMKLDITVGELIKEQEEKRKAELHALQMQINPHFLYNTLNSIKCLVWTGKTSLIIPAINSLVELLQQTLGKQEEWITLEQEINNTKNYMQIHAIRSDSSFTASYHIDERLLNCKMPKLLLQPIVENAIFHGLEPKGSGTVSIYCVPSRNDLRIEVIDNGVGMPLDRPPAKSNISGIGLANVEERIQHCYGPQYGLVIESQVGYGTSVILTIPQIY